jgi:hypothetical protein
MIRMGLLSDYPLFSTGEDRRRGACDLVWGIELLAWCNREIRVGRWFTWRDWWVLGRVVLGEGSGGAERRRAPLWWVGGSRGD